MTWEQLRKTLNDIAEGEQKASLEESVRRMGDDLWCMDLMVSVSSGKLTFVDAMESED